MLHAGSETLTMLRRVIVLPCLVLAGCGYGGALSTPQPASAPSAVAVPGQGVATVRADLAGTGNPWLTLPDVEIDRRGRALCEGLPEYGTRFYTDIADINETTSPGPDEIVPDLDRAQTLQMIKADVDGFCPDHRDMITW